MSYVYYCESRHEKLEQTVEWEEGTFQRLIAGIGLVLLITGVVTFALPMQEPYSETTTLDTWEVQPEMLPPQNSTFYGRSMNPALRFKLDVSSSAPVNVTVSFVQQSPGGPTKVPIFEQTDSSFRQEILIPRSSTYWVDIVNDNPFSVTLEGDILVQQVETNYRTIYPYAIQGFLITLMGIVTMVFGIFRKPKRPSKSKGSFTRGTRSL